MTPAMPVQPARMPLLTEVVPQRAASATEIDAQTALPLSGALLVREMRIDLANPLRDVIAKAVAQELARHRGPADKP